MDLPPLALLPTDPMGYLAGLSQALQALAAGPSAAGPLLLGLGLLALRSATLLPGGTELALLALVQLRPELLLPAFLAASLGNTAGGAISWAMGRGLARLLRPAAEAAVPTGAPGAPGASRSPESPESPARRRARALLARHGAKACALSWLPLVGDPLCVLAGALRLPAGPCLAWMALGKAGRYALLLTLAPGA